MTIREKIGDDDLEEALKDIERILAPSDQKNLKNEVFLHRGRLSRNESDRRKGIIGNREYNKVRNVIGLAILDMLKVMQRRGIETELTDTSKASASDQHNPQEKPAPTPPLKILFLGASPKGPPDLKIPAELKVVKKLLATEIALERIIIKDELSTTYEDFRNLITKEKPDIVHFSGHGSANKKELLFENRDGYKDPVNADRLVPFFQKCSPPISCFIINACDTETIGSQVALNVKYLVAMKAKFENKAAKAFSKGFYFSLGENNGIDVAFEYGKDTIFQEEWPDNEIPILFIDGKKVSE